MDQSNSYKIYILLTYTGTVISSLIKQFSDLPYSHISIGTDDTYRKFYSFGRKYFSNPLIAGFVEEDVKEGVYTRFENTDFELYSLNVTQEQYDEVNKIIHEFERDRKKYRYNFAGLISGKAGIPLNRENAYFCSEFAVELLERAKIYYFTRPAGLVHPMHFLEIPNIEIEAKGKMSEFRDTTWGYETEISESIKETSWIYRLKHS